MKVCVVGAGICGLVALKSCLEEKLEVVCFDKTESIGGLWRFRETDVDGLPSVMKQTVIDTSKEMSALSDFPPSQDYANFMHNTSVVRYFTEYAEHFDLMRNIRFGHEVLRATPHDDDSGKWDVQYKDNKNGKVSQETFDAMMVCSGHHTFPNWPSFEGQDSFEGQMLHTHSYKYNRDFHDKRVLVVGVGNSGTDVTVEMSGVAKNVYWSTRRGVWVVSRCSDNGLPWDLVYSKRYLNFLMTKVLPWDTANSYFEKKATQRMDHTLYNLKPKHRFFQQHVTVGDNIPNAVLAGKVTVKGNVHHFTKHGVVFEDDDTEYPLDVAIFATGYTMRLDFLPDEVITVKQNTADLYRMVFPPNRRTLAVIGFVQPNGAIFPIAEMQSRWAVRVFTGKQSLPSNEEMRTEIEERRSQLRKQFVNTQRHTVECGYIDYMDELAELVGAKPSLLSLAFTDPKLWYACVFGPCLSYQYRIRGPHPWAGARRAILGVDQRMRTPLSTRHKHPGNSSSSTADSSSSSSFSLLMIGLAFVIFLASIVFLFY